VQTRRCECPCLPETVTCDCGLKVGDAVIVTGDTQAFGHSIPAGSEDVLREHRHWNNGTGWQVQSGWDVACEDIQLVNPPVTDYEVNEAIASILKEK
jgi:hypothetical protein